MGMKLFEDGDGDEDVSKIEIDQEFARRYEHNKKREGLQRLEELKKKGLAGDDSDSADSDSESDYEIDSDEDDQVKSSKRDLEFLNALIRLKNHDPDLKQEDAKLFESESENDDEEEKSDSKKKKAKAMYLKDVVAKQLIEEGPAFGDEEEKVEQISKKNKKKTYVEEQEELQKAFLDAVEKAELDGDDGDLLEETKREVNDDIENGNEINGKLDEYFGKDGELDENGLFLKDYFKNRLWVDKDKGKNKLVDEDLSQISEDEEEIDRQDEYEKEYNFRHEEGGEDRVLGHSRFVEGSVRKKVSARKLQRKSKEERMALAEFERKEELKHLKNLKKKEIMEKINKIKEIAGIAEDRACLLDENDLEEDFDPEEYDRKMKETFDEDYYGAEDADPEFGSDKDDDDGDLEKPDFDKEDELLGLPKGWTMEVSSEGFKSAREKYLKNKLEKKNEGVKEEEGENEGKRKRKRKISLQEKVALDKELEEYYKLDYEDTIGDLKTRFKYTSVPPKKYGLKTEEVLMLDDKELNQYVSIKKLAPYRETEWKVPTMKKYNQKMRNKLLLQGEMPNGDVGGKKKSLHGDNDRPNSGTGVIKDFEAQQEEVNVATDSLSRKARRRQRQAEFKLSQSRLLAYGKIAPKSKSKKKH